MADGAILRGIILQITAALRLVLPTFLYEPGGK